MADGDPAPGDNRNTFSADYVARLQADLDKAKEDLRAAAGHTQALTTARQEAAEEALAALRTEHRTALDAATAAHTEALATAQREGSEALTAAHTAATQRVVGFALRAEGATAGLLDMDALRPLDPAEVGKLTVDDAGAVAGAKPLIETMKKAKPFLFGQGSTSNPTPPPKQTPPALKHACDMTDAEFAEANKRKAWRGANAA
jgi:hypothetical protein